MPEEYVIYHILKGQKGLNIWFNFTVIIHLVDHVLQFCFRGVLPQGSHDRS